jgi:prolyl-tRNA synthetase
VYLAPIGENEQVHQAAAELYQDLTNAGALVLYDDRTDVRAGEKFADADLLGIPYRVVVSDKTLANQQFEVKKRGQNETQLLAKSDVIKMISDKRNDFAIINSRS